MPTETPKVAQMSIIGSVFFLCVAAAFFAFIFLWKPTGVQTPEAQYEADRAVYLQQIAESANPDATTTPRAAEEILEEDPEIQARIEYMNSLRGN